MTAIVEYFIFILKDAPNRAECCKRENVQPSICQWACQLDDDDVMLTFMPGDPDSDEWEKLCPCSAGNNPGFAKCFPNLTLGN